jgi:hypothetical protein
MSTQNPVFQVLTTSGNQAPIAAGSRVTALNHGQIGVFNVHTGLSVDGSAAGDCKDVFIAVGINRAVGSGTADDIIQSAGQHIQVRNLKAYMFKGYVPEVQKVVEVTGFSVTDGEASGLKIEYRNQKAYSVNGYNQFAKTYDGTDANGTYKNGTVASNIIKRVNADPDGLVILEGFAYRIQTTIADPTADGNAIFTVGTETFTVALLAADTATTAAAKIAAAINATSTSIYTASSAAAVLQVYPKVAAKTDSTTATIALVSGPAGLAFGTITAANATVAEAGLDAFILANPDAGLGIRITGVAQTRPSFSNDINIQYHKTGTDFIATTPYGMTGASVTTITELQFPEGKGYDLKQLEYQAGGWNGKPGPYRQSTLTGLPRAGYEYLISESANYHQFHIVGEFKAVGGWEAYENSIMNILAIPVADTTTLSGLVAILDLIFAQFQAMANDTTANDTEQVSTNELAANTDGVEILS